MRIAAISAAPSQSIILPFTRMDNLHSVLGRYLPAGTVDLFVRWIHDYHIHLHITRNRRSKSGDYRAPLSHDPRHRISVNHNLNPYAFLITFAHEIAHLVVWEKHRDRVMPHGKEWKSEFQYFMTPFLAGSTFPERLRIVVAAYMKKVYASSCTDLALSRELRKYDSGKELNSKLVEELEPGTLFNIGDNRVFKKGPLMRTRYRCECVSNRRIYFVHANVQVFPVN